MTFDERRIDWIEHRVSSAVPAPQNLQTLIRAVLAADAEFNTPCRRCGTRLEGAGTDEGLCFSCAQVLARRHG